MRNSLKKYYEIKANKKHPFHKYFVLRALPSTYIVADASGALEGVIDGLEVGAGFGPVAAGVSAVVGGVIYGALSSSVAGAVSDLIDSWFK